MKIAWHDARRSAVITAPRMATTGATQCRVRTCRFIETILNSLFDSHFSGPRAAKPMYGRHFQCRVIGGAINFPVIFPVIPRLSDDPKIGR